MDFSIEHIRKILAEANSSQVLSLLLQEQIQSLEREIAEQKIKRDRAVSLLNTLKGEKNLSLSVLQDISLTMKNQKAWRQLQFKTLIAVLCPLPILIALGILLNDIWISPLVLSYLGWINYILYRYIKKINYLCPSCHRTFEISYKTFSLAPHTPRTHKLTCPHRHERSYCLEMVKE